MKRIKGYYDGLIREYKINIETREKFYETANSTWKDTEQGIQYEITTSTMREHLAELEIQNETINHLF